MSTCPLEQPAPGSEFMLYQTEDGRNRIEVRLENESVWLEAIKDELSEVLRVNGHVS